MRSRVRARFWFPVVAPARCVPNFFCRTSSAASLLPGSLFPGSSHHLPFNTALCCVRNTIHCFHCGSRFFLGTCPGLLRCWILQHATRSATPAAHHCAVLHCLPASWMDYCCRFRIPPVLLFSPSVFHLPHLCDHTCSTVALRSPGLNTVRSPCGCLPGLLPDAPYLRALGQTCGLGWFAFSSPPKFVSGYHAALPALSWVGSLPSGSAHCNVHAAFTLPRTPPLRVLWF